MGSRSGLLESLASPSRPGLLLRLWTGRWAPTLATQQGPSSAMHPPCTHSRTLASLGHCAPSPQEGVAISLLAGDSRLSGRIKTSGPGEPIAGPAWHRGSLPPLPPLLQAWGTFLFSLPHVLLVFSVSVFNCGQELM